MKRMMFLTAMALFAVCLSGQAQKFLDIYKNDIVVNSVRVAEVDSMVVDVGTNNRLVYFFFMKEKCFIIHKQPTLIV